MTTYNLGDIVTVYSDDWGAEEDDDKEIYTGEIVINNDHGMGIKVIDPVDFEGGHALQYYEEGGVVSPMSDEDYEKGWWISPEEILSHTPKEIPYDPNGEGETDTDI